MQRENIDISDRHLPVVVSVRRMVIACAVLSFWELVYPFNFQRWVVTPWLSDVTIGKLNTLGNLVLFLPYGLMTAWMRRLRSQSLGMTVFVVTVCGAGLSLLGETVQVWLPGRYSSIVDLVANTAGAGVGAVLGWHAAPLLTAKWQGLTQWLDTRSVARRAIIIIASVVVLKTAPFDVSPETFYMRWSLWDAYNAGWPLSAVWNWYRYPRPGPALQEAAALEIARAAMNFVLFALATVALGRAVRESALRKGDRAYPIDAIILLGVSLVLVTELLQWPVRSRLMDATDIVAGIAGVCLVAGVSWLRNLARHRR